MLGVTARPTRVDDMIMPPQAHGLKVISIGMFTAGNDAVVWRGPMLHRALQQFLADVFWGDLDVLLLDLANPYRYVELRGDAVLEPDDDYAFADRVGARYGADLRTNDEPGDTRVVVTIRAARVHTWG